MFLNQSHGTKIYIFNVCWKNVSEQIPCLDCCNDSLIGLSDLSFPPIKSVFHTSPGWSVLDGNLASLCLILSGAPFVYNRGPQPPESKPDDLRWSWCHNNRNKVHNKCSVLESPWNHPRAWKSCLPWNWSLVPDTLETSDLWDIV